MTRYILIALLFTFHFSPTMAADEEPLEFKGIKLGTKLGTFRQDSAYRCRPGQSPTADYVCSTVKNVSIAGVTANLLMLSFYDDELNNISVIFPSKNFSEVLSGLVEKYGPPDARDVSTIQNRMGASFENIKATWKGAAGTVIAEKYSTDLVHSGVSYSTNQRHEKFSERYKESKKERAKDL